MGGLPVALAPPTRAVAKEKCGLLTSESCGERKGSSLETNPYPIKYKMGLIGTLVVAGILSAIGYVQSRPPLSNSTSNLAANYHDLPALPSYDLDPEIAYNLGPYGPRYAVPCNISSEVPVGCSVTMINVLQRHGARYPTSGAGASINAALAKLKAVQNITEPSLQFVPGFTFSFIAEQLVLFGRNQSFISGQIIAKKYAALGSAKFIRAAEKERIVESARWWRHGFEGGAFGVAISSLPQPDVTIRIGDTSNNTLAPQTCVASETLDPSPGDIASGEWLVAFAPSITKRLNGFLPGANLNDNDTAALMSLCGFDTAAKNGAASPWCNIFTKEEWRNNEYYSDLEKYYSNFYGSTYSRCEGSGWVNELLARFTGRPVRDNTTTNSTLDSNPATFPIGASAPSIFADFSSDNNMAKILSATGILRDKANLPQTGPIPSTQQFVVSKIVPFAGSIVVEKISCPAKNSAMSAGDYVRIIVNDAVVPLNSAACGHSGSTSGICPLNKFIQSQAFARAGGNFTSCFNS